MLLHSILKLFVFGLIMLVLYSCADQKNETTSNPNPEKEIVDTTYLVHDTVIHIDTIYMEEPESDSLIAIPLFTNPNELVKSWKTIDFIISCESDYFTEDLIHQIEYDRAIWAGISSPLMATYRGNEIGDYFHLNFEGDTSFIYDFGFGNNDYGEFELFSGDSYEDNPKYLHKKFLVYWEWKPSIFPCCSGEYYKAEAYMPSIIKLELVE